MSGTGNGTTNPSTTQTSDPTRFETRAYRVPLEITAFNYGGDDQPVSDVNNNCVLVTQKLDADIRTIFANVTLGNGSDLVGRWQVVIEWRQEGNWSRTVDSGALPLAARFDVEAPSGEREGRFAVYVLPGQDTFRAAIQQELRLELVIESANFRELSLSAPDYRVSCS